MLINAAWGLGENVVQGAVDPDEYLVFKPLLADTALTPIIEKTLRREGAKMVYAPDGEHADQERADTRRPSARPSC